MLPSVLLLAVVLVGGCGGTGTGRAAPNVPTPAAAGSGPSASTAVSSAPPSTTASSPSAPPPTPTPGPGPVSGGQPVVVLDPGHNGGNANAPAQINKPVPAGRGKQKPCNTTGTSTSAGYSEHAFTWDVAQRVRDILAGHGVTVLLTRNSDSGVGPCVNERAAVGNRADATAVVSIHGDGSDAAGAHGFHVAYSSPPLDTAQAAPSISLASMLRDTLRADGLQPANYIGSQGLAGRSDLSGLNLSEVPTALVECANMRDAADAAAVSSPTGRQRYAAAIANGILHWLTR